MKATIYFKSLRQFVLYLERMSFWLIILLLFISTILTAQVKIKERVEIMPNDSVNSVIANGGDPKGIFPLRYAADVCFEKLILRLPWDHYQWTFSCNGRTDRIVPSTPDDYVDTSNNYWYNEGGFGIFTAGTNLTFYLLEAGDPPESVPVVDRPIYIYEDTIPGFANPWTDDCGGVSNIYNSIEDMSYIWFAVSRADFCPPINIITNDDAFSEMMYGELKEIVIGLRDACGRHTSETGAIAVNYHVEITSGHQWGYLYNPSTGQTGDTIDVTADNCWATIMFAAYEQKPIEDQLVTLRVWSDNPSFAPTTREITVKSISCMLMSITKPIIQPGEKDTITMMQMMYDGSVVPYPPDQIFSIRLKTNDQYGMLRCPATSEEGTEIYGTQPFEFIAADSIDVSSVEIEIEASVTTGFIPCSIGTISKDTLHAALSVRTTNRPVEKSEKKEREIKSLEMMIGSVESSLARMTAKGDEESKIQKSSDILRMLKARLENEQAKRQAEKQNLLTKNTQQGPSIQGIEECRGTVSVTIQKPMHLELWSISETVYYGDTVDVYIVPCNSDSLFSQLGPDGDYEFSVALRGETSQYGELIYEGVGDTLFESIPSVDGWGDGVKFAANGIEPDSVVDLTFHLIAKYIGPEGSIRKPSAIKLMQKGRLSHSLINGRSEKSSSNSNLNNANPKLRTEYEPSEIVVENDYNKKTSEPIPILLGQSKYCYAVEDKGVIKIKWTEDLTKAPDGCLSKNVTWKVENLPDELTKKVDPFLYVYYDEFKCPDWNGHTFSGMEDLPSAGMLRILGRYWNKDKTYIVKLKVEVGTGENKKEAKVLIEIKKPKQLGGDDAIAVSGRFYLDIDDQTINIDEICIEYGGKIGIPPQLIKGQIRQECNYNEVLKILTPSFRFEPWTTAINIYYQGKYRNSDYYIRSLTDNEMGKGLHIPSAENPPPHNNVGKIEYILSPKSLWNFVYDYSQLAISDPPPGRDPEITPDQHKIYGERTSDGKMIFKGYQFSKREGIQQWYDNLYEMFRNNGEVNAGVLAREALAVAFRDEIFGVGASQITAQTRIASSYGFLQIMYVTAIDKKYGVDYPLTSRPEDLNVLSLSEYYQFKRLKKIVDVKIEEELNSIEGNWDMGFEEFIKTEIYPAWNSGGNYPSKVFENSTYYNPQE